MDVDPNKITIRELKEDYKDDGEDGVTAFAGKLDVRPPYQREFVYKEKERNLVIDTVKRGFPLNTMYWNVKDDGTFEILDGQQRTISICEYVTNQFSVPHDGRPKKFNRLPADVQRTILDYKLDIYHCKGDESERIDWFEIINIRGAQLTHQEILNAVYPGPWTSDARRKFSKRNCPAADIGKNYMSGQYIRQDYMHTVLKWISNDDVKGYMNEHCKDDNADKLWLYFEKVISWAKLIFGETNINTEMKSVPWGRLFNVYGEEDLDSEQIRSEVLSLFNNKNVTSKVGIYTYVLDGKEKHLSIRQFDAADKLTAFNNQGGVCIAPDGCEKVFEFNEMEGDHIKAWNRGGTTEFDNLQMLCRECNRMKGDK